MSSTFKDFGDLVLVIGDFHVPQRAADMPKCFKELLETDKIGHVLCTGNVGCRTVYDRLKQIAPNVHIVKGDTDTDFDFPECKVVTIGELKIGLLHGHQVLPWGSTSALCEWQRRLDCDILVAGHTHRHMAEQLEGKFFINPGSATGAYQSFLADPIPSFMLMAVQETEVILYVYEEKNGKPNVIMSEFRKGQ